MVNITERIDILEKKQIECSTALTGQVSNLETNLEKQYKKLDALPWKILGIVGTTITISLTICMLVFKISIEGVQKQYEAFTEKIVTLEIQNINNEIKRLHNSDNDTLRLSQNQ
jgi:hypothetical protein